MQATVIAQIMVMHESVKSTEKFIFHQDRFKDGQEGPTKVNLVQKGVSF